MRIVAAPDSFKGSMSSAAAARAIAAGIGDAAPDVEVAAVPIADGGEGTCEAILAALGGERQHADVEDPLGRPVRAAWGWVAERRLAVVEMAAASGLPLVADRAPDPGNATTHGTGALVRAALDRGARTLVLGLGGSATVDGGAGFLQALGVRFLDAEGHEVRAAPATLDRVAAIDVGSLDPRLAAVDVTVAADVSNPLLGPEGAVRVFGPQKGVSDDAVGRFEAALGGFAARAREATGRDCAGAPGAGAAGGLGYAAMSVLGAAARSGFELVAELSDLQAQIEEAALVVTGEGRLDGQSRFGKAPIGVARMARAAGRPCVAFAGAVDGAAEDFRRLGLDVVVPIVDRPMTLAEAMADGEALLRRAARRFIEAVRLGGPLPPGSPPA